MAYTYEPIATNTLGSDTATVTFSSIPGTYTDLVLVLNSRSASTSGGVFVQFNNDTGSNYSVIRLRGNGTAASSNNSANVTTGEIGDQNVSTNTAGNFGNIICQINNYSNSTTYKTTLSRANVADVTVRALVSLWRSTSAITEIDIFCENSNNFLSGSTFTLYGIKAA